MQPPPPSARNRPTPREYPKAATPPGRSCHWRKRRRWPRSALGLLPLLARHGQGNGRRPLAVVNMRLVHGNEGRSHDGHAENRIHHLQDARLEANAMIVLLQLANGQEDHLVIE